MHRSEGCLTLVARPVQSQVLLRCCKYLRAATTRWSGLIEPQSLATKDENTTILQAVGSTSSITQSERMNNGQCSPTTTALFNANGVHGLMVTQSPNNGQLAIDNLSGCAQAQGGPVLINGDIIDAVQDCQQGNYGGNARVLFGANATAPRNLLICSDNQDRYGDLHRVFRYPHLSAFVGHRYHVSRLAPANDRH